MTNREKYKQAFSALHPSGVISLEVERMMLKHKKARIRTAAAAAAACLLLTCGSGAVYASNVGGIQRTIQLWIHGDQTDVEFVYHEDGTSELSYRQEDGSIVWQGHGGVAFDPDGNERPLTESEILEELNMPDAEYREDGTVWLYYGSQKLEITDRFEDGVCYVKVSDGEKTLYVTVKYQAGLAASPDKYVSPDSFNTGE